MMAPPRERPASNAGSGTQHDTVMLAETLAVLRMQPRGRYLDCTLGGGGHAESILEASQPGGSLLGIDADPEALERTQKRLARFGSAFMPVEGNFSDLDAICQARGFQPVNGILFDLGLSSDQLASDRGFSFQQPSPLDMRFSPDQDQTASDWVNESSEEDLANVIYQYGEERQ